MKTFDSTYTGFDPWLKDKDLTEKFSALIRAAVRASGQILGDKDATDKEPIMPVFVILDDTNSLTIVGTPYSNDREKDETAATVREILKERRAVAYVHVAEAWMKTLQKKDIPADLKELRPASEYPDAQDVVQFYCECVGEKPLMLHAPIITVNGKKALGEVAGEKAHGTSGRFTKLLPTAVKN